jgi:zinc/manganese transport system permease protein
MPRKKRLLIGYAIGATAYLGGIILSAIIDLPTGAIVVWTMAAVSLIVGLTASKKTN